MLAGGAAGGGVAFAVAGSAAPPAPGHAVTASSSASAGEDVAARIDDLEAALRALRKKSAAAQALREYAGALSRGESDGGARGSIVSGVVDAEDPVFELAVRGVMDAIEWEREEERRVTRAARRSERARRQAEAYARELGLTPAQQKKLEEALISQLEAFRTLREPPDGGARPAGRREWRAALAKIRSDTEAKLAGVLDEKQLAAYRALRDEEESGWGGAAPGRSRAGGER